MLHSLARPALREAEDTHDSSTPPDPSGGPCNRFRIDMAATTFNMCKCGYKKEAHTASTPVRDRSPPATRVALVSEEARASAATRGGKGDAPCDTFRLDLTAGFGVCKCGFKKGEHA
jgi:hypothetical protein